ncbi:MAG: hypothetical protein JNJ98_14185 [Gemmatimonadetes bacterium]|nr:hypothetical protein [Gemmatimonadota bacterium]
MNSRQRSCLATAAALAAAACGDQHIRALDEGISRDSTLRILADGVAPRGDTIQNVYNRKRFLVEGREFDIYMFDAQNRRLWADPEVEDKELVPVVVVNGKLEGWGWDHMDDVTSKYGILMRARDVADAAAAAAAKAVPVPPPDPVPVAVDSTKPDSTRK